MSHEPTREITFRTPRRHVLGEVLLVVLTTPVILVVGLILASVSAQVVSSRIHDAAARESLALGLAVAVPVFSFFCLFAWLWAKHRLKFTLLVGSPQLHFGRRPFRESLPCLSVETIRVLAEEAGNPLTHRVEVVGAGRKWVCFLGGSTLPCVQELLPLCTNAVYVDMDGAEHLPRSTYQPVRVVDNLVRTRRRRGIGALLFAALLLGWSAMLLVAVALHVADGQSLLDAVARIPVMFLAIPSLAVASLITGVVQLRKAFVLSARIRAARAPGLRDATSDTAVDLSESGIDRL